MKPDSSISLAISGMSCGHCVAAVRKAIATIPGIADAQVAVGSATLNLEPGADAGAVGASAVQAIQDAGYDAHERH
jgi:copper chaperone CopZ